MPEEFGPYRLVLLLGRGGMGEVWRAVDNRKGREVALKVLGSWLGGDPDFAERFRRECELASGLTSPHVVPIHDYGEIDGRLYLEMPLIEGTDLATLLKDGPLPPARAVGIVVQVARALSTAHKAGLVHRDVKPANVLVSTSDDGDDHAYLIDFGIARALDGTRLSMSGALIGTAAYMAPECFAGEGDARSDVYSLGCVLFETLTGQQPFTAPHAFAYARLHEHERPPHPSAVRTDAPTELDGVVARVLAKKPEDRFATATAFASAAREALRTVSSPPVADPPSRPDATTVPAERTPNDAVTAPSTSPTRVVNRPAPQPTPPAPPARRRSWWWAIVAVLTVSVLTVVWTAVIVRDAPAPNLILRGHTDMVRAVATADLDGRPVAVSGSVDRTVRAWDLTTGQQVGQPLTGHTGGVYAVAAAELNGRSVAITGSDVDFHLRLWDLPTGRQIGQPFTGDGPLAGHGGTVQAVAATQLDGRPVVVTGSLDHTAGVWDLTTGQQIGQPLVHSDGVLAVATTQLDGRPIAVTGGEESAVHMWDLDTGKPIGQPLAGHTSRVRGVAITPLDGRPIAVTGSDDKTVRVWDLTTGQPIGQPIAGHTGGVYAVNTTELNGRPVAVTGGEDNTVRTWDLLAAAGL